ncbi:hypothetical protein PUNSTDRAFT_87214 [Punctularia strigosozonata HHB-11173 SS5]|uniref:uncharacterized protein n=1 Tax=Punctularia strigosozonata (strain HHB-11173) TaxID=741275 RepID=UPI000441728D|nr:uncharacterized protein PUNSTDRAFT_87214 [Punctularia strigosozonata HHB-11173 SS5]EIN09095.1 hypothetical protein PUNSTDRAFT_87214 [Punctularia strigosozonata HHB-11173 SS5]
MPEHITLYTAKICPYAHRTEIALEEAGAEYERYEIDLQNKPEWYAPKVNPASKVPAIAYGGPKVPADQPSPESVKLAESLILVEFVADLYPQSGSLPSDPVLRAKARFFIDAVSNKLLPAYNAWLRKGESYESFLKGIEAIQSLLPQDKKYAVGDDFTAADIAILPFLARLSVVLDNDLGAYPEGESKKVLEALSGPQFARYNQYVQDLKARPSFIKTWDEPYVTKVFKERFASLRQK